MSRNLFGGAASRWLLLYIPVLLIFIAVTLFLALRLPRISGGLTIDNPRFEQEPPDNVGRLLPSIVRYVSSLKGHEGKICFGLVLAAQDGVPQQVLNLTAIRPALGSSFATFVGNDGFRLADEMFELAARKRHTGLFEMLGADNLAKVIKPPVDVSLSDLEAGKRFIIGVGFNYAQHRKETDSGIDKFMFAKFVVPAGPYEPVPLGKGAGMKGPKLLVDYEAEIGFVLLEDIDLNNPPNDRDAFDEKIAFFTANDVTDRLPLILEGESAFTRAKSHPSYLPIGPWMVHGRHLKLRTRSGGEEALRLWLRIDEAEPFPGGTWRQDASSADIIRGPFEIIRMAAEIYQRSIRPDAAGIPRGIARTAGGRMIIPAGSLVIMGTPEGTAIEAPTDLDRARLLVRASISTNRAKQLFARHCIANRKEMGFLHVGDTVETRIQYLGRQYWKVRE